MEQKEKMPYWVYLGLWSIKTRKVALGYFIGTLLLMSIIVPASIYYNDYFYSIFAFVPLWYWLSIKWVDNNSTWEVATQISNNKPNILLGFLVAPLVAPIIIFFIFMVAGENSLESFFELGTEGTEALLAVAVIFIGIGSLIAYAITLLLGLPSYLLFNKLNFINYWSVTFGSAFLAILPILIYSANNNFILYNDPEKSSLLFYLSFAFAGYVVGIVFWITSALYKQRVE